MLISDNGISRVWRSEDGWIYKKQPKHLTDNEWWALQTLYKTGYVPYAESIDIDTIRMEDLGESEPVTDAEAFMRHRAIILQTLKDHGLRHGDLTEYAIIVKDNKPMIIDWAESRVFTDPRPDKRREGDAFWLTQTMQALCP